MKLNEMLRLIAGVFVLLAIILGVTVHPYWNYFRSEEHTSELQSH